MSSDCQTLSCCCHCPTPQSGTTAANCSRPTSTPSLPGACGWRTTTCCPFARPLARRSCRGGTRSRRACRSGDGVVPTSASVSCCGNYCCRRCCHSCRLSSVPPHRSAPRPRHGFLLLPPPNILHRSARSRPPSRTGCTSTTALCQSSCSSVATPLWPLGSGTWATAARSSSHTAAASRCVRTCATLSLSLERAARRVESRRET
jgi:hypothetical protein